MGRLSLHAAGCSASPEGVDDDRVGVALNYVCGATLLAAALLLHRRGGRRAARGVCTELGMALGYLLGGAYAAPRRASRGRSQASCMTGTRTARWRTCARTGSSIRSSRARI